MANIEIQIDPEFEQMIPPHAEGETAALERSLLVEGCRDPLILWKGHGILLDGHTRYRICLAHDIPYRWIEVELADREAVKVWIRNCQMERRNLTREAASYVRGQHYLECKQERSPGRPKKGGQTGPLKTADRLAAEYKVSAKTIKRDARFKLKVDAIVEQCGADSRKVLLSRDYGMTYGGVARLAKLTPQEQRDYLESLKKDRKAPRKERGKANGSTQAMAKSLVERLGKKGEDHAVEVLRYAAEFLGWTLAKKIEQ